MRSYVPDFQLIRPEGLEAALECLAGEESCLPFAGGTDLMVLLNAGKLVRRRFCSLKKLQELQQIHVTPTGVAIGAAVTYAQLQGHPVLQAEFPLLCQAASWTGGIANQNQGTLGGNIANASPAADSATPLLVYDAQMQIVSLEQSRTVPYAAFHRGYKLMDLRPGELIAAITLPRSPDRWQAAGRKVGTRRAQAISKIAFAGAARVHASRVQEIRLAFGSVAPVPLRCAATEKVLLDVPLTRAAVAAACDALLAEIEPIDDIRSTAHYRSQVACNLLAEFLGNLRDTH